MAKEEDRGKRLARFLPVVVMVTIIGVLYAIYILYHCLPLLQLEIPTEFRDEEAFSSGVVHTTIVHLISVMLLWSFWKTLDTDPGKIPDTTEWSSSPNRSMLREKKRDGSLRYCHKCKKYKPDRAHHSSSTNECVLKMDHYCPWVANDVGFFNYKFFWLTLLYSAMDLLLIAFTMIPTVRPAFEDINIPFEEAFFIFLGVALSLVVLCIICPFWIFHTWLISHNTTTIEYCEKRRSGIQLDYNLGIVTNIKAVLGDKFLLWLLPIGGCAGNGLFFQHGEAIAESIP